MENKLLKKIETLLLTFNNFFLKSLQNPFIVFLNYTFLFSHEPAFTINIAITITSSIFSQKLKLRYAFAKISEFTAI